VQRALPQAERRLPMARELAVPFAQDGPEARLIAALGDSGPAAQPYGAPFPAGSSAADAWDRAHEAFSNVLVHLRRLVTGVSWVETAIEGRTIARTVIRRLGDQSTVWDGTVRASAASLHMRALALALGSSAALMRSLEIAVRGLSILGLVSSGPASALLALPLVWNFVDDVVSQMRRFRVGEVPGSLLP
jgi:hypothetical protein